MYSKQTRVCKLCGQATLATHDMLGHTVCTSPFCGAVCEEMPVDEAPDRHFEADSEKSRTNGPIGDSVVDVGTIRSDDEYHLIGILQTISSWVTTLNLPPRLSDSATTIYKSVYVQHPSRTKRQHGMPAAALHMAAVEDKRSLPMKEILNCTHTTRKKLLSALKFAKESGVEGRIARPEEYISRACPLLELSTLEVACYDVASNATQIATGCDHSAVTIAAASILFVVQLHCDEKARARVTANEIGDVMFVDCKTIKTTFKEFLPHWKELIPTKRPTSFKLRSNFSLEEGGASGKEEDRPRIGVKRERDVCVQGLRSLSEMSAFAETETVQDENEEEKPHFV